MFIVQGMTPATKTQPAMPEILATFERYQDAQSLIKIFNRLTEHEKKDFKNKELVIDNVLEKDEEITKVVKIRNEYTILYVEEI